MPSLQSMTAEPLAQLGVVVVVVGLP